MVMEQDGEDIKTGHQPVLPAEISYSVQKISMESLTSEGDKQESHKGGSISKI